MTRALLLAALALAAAPAATPQEAPAPRPKAPPAAPQALIDLEAEFEKLEAEWEQHRAERRRTENDLMRIASDLETVTDRLARGQATAADRDAVRRRLELVRSRLVVVHTAESVAESRYQSARDRLAFPTGRFGASVGGTLAVDVAFPADKRLAVADAALALLTGATDRAADAPAAAWDAARRGCHVVVRFPTPARTRIAVGDGPTVAIAEVLVSLPLTRAPGGFVLARDGARVVRFTKYPHDACVRFQEALAAAVPAAR